MTTEPRTTTNPGLGSDAPGSSLSPDPTPADPRPPITDPESEPVPSSEWPEFPPLERAEKPITAPKAVDPVLAVRGLDVALPDGTKVVEGADLALVPGQVFALLGPSGAGKSTLLRAVLSPDELCGRGYAIRWDEREVAAEVAFIPQRGALFDHLDVGGNIALALAAGGGPPGVEPWLQAVDLDPSLAAPGTSVATLSGGQAQRVAVARTLAAGRAVLILDEPSVGLDPLGVRRLARLLVQQARERGVAILVITHDVALAAGAADRALFLDVARRRLVDLVPGSGGPAELAPDAVRRERVLRLDEAVAALLERAEPAPVRAGKPRQAQGGGGPGAIRVLGAALLHALNPRLAGPSTGVLLRAVRQSFLRPLPFYAIVGLLLGFTVLYIIAKMSADLRAAAVLRLVGGTYILSLAPPLSAILFASTSGNAVNAWLGGMQLGRQVLALDGLGVPAPRYLWSPAWIALAASYLLTLLAFAAAMVGGGYLLFLAYGVRDAIPILTSDFLDPAPGRLPYLVRGVWLAIAYATAIATIVVERGAAPKDEAAHVTSAMTSAVVRTTLFVVAMELASVIALFALTGK